MIEFKFIILETEEIMIYNCLKVFGAYRYGARAPANTPYLIHFPNSRLTLKMSQPAGLSS